MRQLLEASRPDGAEPCSHVLLGSSFFDPHFWRVSTSEVARLGRRLIRSHCGFDTRQVIRSSPRCRRQWRGAHPERRLWCGVGTLPALPRPTCWRAPVGGSWFKGEPTGDQPLRKRKTQKNNKTRKEKSDTHTHTPDFVHTVISFTTGRYWTVAGEEARAQAWAVPVAVRACADCRLRKMSYLAELSAGHRCSLRNALRIALVSVWLSCNLLSATDSSSLHHSA